MPLKPLSRLLAEPGGAQAHHLHDTGLGLTSGTRRRPHQQASCRHLLCLPSQLFRRSRAETPREVSPLSRGVISPGAQPLSARLPDGIRFLPPPLPAVPSATTLRRAYPEGRTTGLPRSTDDITDGLGSASSPVARQRRQGKGDTPAPGHVPFGSSLSAPLACWFSRRLSAVHLG